MPLGQTVRVPPQNEERKKRLTNAAIDVLARDGGHGMTHRAVDKEAGVPTGTTSNYFRTREALWDAVANRLTERLWERIQTIEGYPERMADPFESSEAMSELLTGHSEEGRRVSLAILELNLEAIRRPGLREILRRLNEMVTGQMEVNFRALSLPHDRETLDLISMYLRGLQLSLLMPWNLGQDYEPRQLIERAFRGLLSTAQAPAPASPAAQPE